MTESQEKIDDNKSGTDEDSDDIKINLSEKGRRMAQIVAEYLLMRYFFPEMKKQSGPKMQKMNQIKTAFITDMQFSLTNGQVTRATDKFRNRQYLVSNLKNIFNKSHSRTRVGQNI